MHTWVSLILLNVSIAGDLLKNLNVFKEWHL